MKTDTSTKSWSSLGTDWIEADQSNDFRMYYIMPYTLEKLGDVTGYSLLDLGCGEGGYSRALAKKGAQVTSIDCTETLITYASHKAKEESLNIHHFVRNSNDLYDLKDNSFDLVLCSMMMMDVEDMDGTLREVYRVLRPEGKVFISVLHPCFKPPIEHKWFRDGDAIEVRVKDYFHPEEWSGTIGNSSNQVIYRHRTLSDYVKAFTKARLTITDLNEPIPTKEQVAQSERIGWLQKIPMYLFWELKK